MPVGELVADGLLPAPDDLPAAHPDRVAAILHTSGTTDLPKRVPRGHRSFVAAARAARQTTGLTPDGVALLVGGVYTNAGLSNMLFALLTGGSCAPAGFDPALIPDWIAEHRPTWALLNATELNLILEAAARAGRRPLAERDSRLRAIRAGAQPMTPGTAERAEAFFGAAVFEGYGMSEASNIAKSGPRLQDRRPGSCGRPVSDTIEVRILDDAGNEAGPGVTGAVVVRGPTVFSGISTTRRANAAAFTPDGWFRTGDVGCLDEDGFLYLSGRQSEIINRGGENIAPAEVDRAPAAAPHGGRSGRLRRARCAVWRGFGRPPVVIRAGMSASPRELRTWMLDRLTPHKAPCRIWIVEALPRTPSGKVQRANWRGAGASANSDRRAPTFRGDCDDPGSAGLLGSPHPGRSGAAVARRPDALPSGSLPRYYRGRDAVAGARRWTGRSGRLRPRAWVCVKRRHAGRPDGSGRGSVAPRGDGVRAGPRSGTPAARAGGVRWRGRGTRSRRRPFPASPAASLDELVTPEAAGSGFDAGSCPVDPDTTAAILHTSGSTGWPAGARARTGRLYPAPGRRSRALDLPGMTSCSSALGSPTSRGWGICSTRC